MEIKYKDSTIRWFGYPTIFFVTASVTRVCENPDAFLFKGCGPDPEVFPVFFIMGAAFLEACLWERNKKIKLKEKRRIAKEQEEIERYEQETQRRQEELIKANKQEKLQIYRTDIIKKLGSIGNYLSHLIDPAYSEKQAFIKQQIATEFNEIIAKYPLADLRELIHKNEDIQHKLRNLDKKCNSQAIENDDLEIMLKLLPEN